MTKQKLCCSLIYIYKFKYNDSLGKYKIIFAPSLIFRNLVPFEIRTMERKSLFFIFSALLGFNAMAGDWKSINLNSHVTGVQPMTGLVLWPDESKSRFATYGKSHALEFSYVAPCKVVTGCDVDGTIQYDWSYLDNLLDDVKSRNHQAIIRFFYEYPGVKMVDDKPGTTGVPAYIKARSDYKESYKNVAGDGETYYADWSNSELQRFTKQFYADFSQRYESDPRIAFVEVGFGHWSEYHIYDDNGVKIEFGKNFPTKAYQKEFFQYLSTVMNIPWSISKDAASSEYTPFASDKDLRQLQFGIFDDSFMHEDHEIGSADGYNEECWNTMGKNRWQTGVCGGEISYYSDKDQKNFTNPAGLYGHTWEEQSAKYHISFMIANDNPSGKNSYNNATRFKECSMATGYHFVVTSCQSDGTQTNITVKNTGVAPLYKDAFFAIGAIRSSETLRGLLPGESIDVTIPASLESDKDGMALTNPKIVSDFILDTQTIEYDYESTATGVEEIKLSDSDSNHPRYNILGKKVSDNYRGIIVGQGTKHFKE